VPVVFASSVMKGLVCFVSYVAHLQTTVSVQLARGQAVHHARFGPDACVSISHSSQGTCVLATDCGNRNLTEVDFAFDCQMVDGSIDRHSFGYGGFDSLEEFDTGVPCAKCLAPSQASKFLAPGKSMQRSTEGAKPSGMMAVASRRLSQTATKQDWGLSGADDDQITNYGPQSCVSVWKNRVGECVMQTDCTKKAIHGYDFGLVCVDRIGVPTRHLFGKHSFDVRETFNTLIRCDRCLGLEDLSHTIRTNGQLAVLTSEVRELEGDMKDARKDLRALQNEVLRRDEEAEEAEEPEEEEEEESGEEEEDGAEQRSRVHTLGTSSPAPAPASSPAT